MCHSWHNYISFCVTSLIDLFCVIKIDFMLNITFYCMPFCLGTCIHEVTYHICSSKKWQNYALIWSIEDLGIQRPKRKSILRTEGQAFEGGQQKSSSANFTTQELGVLVRLSLWASTVMKPDPFRFVVSVVH